MFTYFWQVFKIFVYVLEMLTYFWHVFKEFFPPLEFWKKNLWHNPLVLKFPDSVIISGNESQDLNAGFYHNGFLDDSWVVSNWECRITDCYRSGGTMSFLDASSHLYVRVCPSVGPSVRRSVGWLVGRSVTLLSKTREINIFEQNSVIGGILGPLDASSQLYKMVYRSIGLSVYWSVCDTSGNINLNKSKPK